MSIGLPSHSTDKRLGKVLGLPLQELWPSQKKNENKRPLAPRTGDPAHARLARMRESSSGIQRVLHWETGLPLLIALFAFGHRARKNFKVGKTQMQLLHSAPSLSRVRGAGCASSLVTNRELKGENGRISWLCFSSAQI